MDVNIKQFLSECGMDEPLYPGKRLVQKMPQNGEFKSHCVVYDWRVPDTLRLEIKAGLSGRDLSPKDKKNYPVSFQAPTYVDIAANDDEDEEEGESGSGSKGGGGKGHKKKKSKTFEAFSKVVEGKIPESGEVKKMVLMGKEIAKAAMATVLGSLAAQIKNMAINPVNILAAANAVKVTKATPGGGLKPTGTEDITYKYKGNDMFGVSKPG